MKHLYVCEWAPNGTNDLVIVDEDNQIIEVISEALFGVRVSIDHRIDGQTALIEDFIGTLATDDLEAGVLVNSISLETALKRIAVSPVNDGRETVATLMKHFGE